MEQYYVLNKFAKMERSLTGIIQTMPIKRRALDIYKERNNIKQAKEMFSDLETIKGELIDTVRNLGLLFSECEMKDSADFSNMLFGSLGAFNIMTPDYTKLISALETLMEKIPHSEKANASIIGRLMNSVKVGYYPTDISHVKKIKDALKFPDCKVNILDPCCGCGLALETLSIGVDADTYGFEIDESRGKEAEKRLSRVGFGSYFESKSSSEAFHALFLNPPYLNVFGEGGIKTRSEKRFLVESIRNLMIGGVIIYIVPYYRLTYDICRILCDNFDNISVYRFLEGEFSKFKQVAILGVRKERGNGKKEAELLSQYAMLPDKIPSIDTLVPGCYEIPENPKEVSLFKGEKFNLGELQRQLAHSKSINMLFEKSKLDSKEHRPLLPLNSGQIGLIGGSGLINGYVDCENPHIIKGRVIKEVIKRENPEMNTLTETRVNRMLFNILTPDGVKRLA